VARWWWLLSSDGSASATNVGTDGYVNIGDYAVTCAGGVLPALWWMELDNLRKRYQANR